MKLNQVNQKRKGSPLLVTLCLTSAFLLLCGGDPDTNGSGSDTVMHNYVCSNGTPVSGATTTKDLQRCGDCDTGFTLLDSEMCVTTVSISLNCTTGRVGNQKCTSSPKKISNTIKEANLPIYTVARSASTSDPLTVTLEWMITGNNVSSETTRYLENPQISFQRGSTITFSNPGCNLHTPNDAADGFYSFKFLGNGTDPAPTVDKTKKSITVTIPANSKTVAFRLDPFRCPDFTSPSNNQAQSGSTANVSIGIVTTSNNEVLDTASEILKIEYKNLMVDSND